MSVANMQWCRAQRLVRQLAVAGCIGLAASSQAYAQGSLSGLGLGYPVGGTSVRGAATAGAFGEFDLLSPLNPASLGGVDRVIVAAQTEPEFRRLRLGTVSEKSTAQRVPLVMIITPASHGVGLSISAASYLDHSYSTVTSTSQAIDGATIATTDRTDVRGSIADLRAAAGWRINNTFSVGLGAHLFQGDNLVAISRAFTDTTKFGNSVDSTRAVFFGTALSVGAEWRVMKGLAAMASYRRGGTIDARVRDTVRASAQVPNRLGVGVRFDGISGAVFAASIDQQQWTQMRALGSAAVLARDATSWHVGAEFDGPRIREVPLQFRFGYARNALPFGLSSHVVNETRTSGGMGIPIARDQAFLDLSIQRANRTLVGTGATEAAWLLGVGLQIRP